MNIIKKTLLIISIVLMFNLISTSTSIIGKDNINNELDAVTSATPIDGFNVSVSPTAQELNRGNSATFMVTIAFGKQFYATVSLSVSIPPKGVTYSFNPSNLNPAKNGEISTLTISTSAFTAIGTSNLMIAGVGGGKNSAAPLVILINPATTIVLKIGDPLIVVNGLSKKMTIKAASL